MNISQIHSTKPSNLCLPFISVGSRDRFRLEKICLLCTYLHSTYLHSYSHFSRPWVASLHLRTLAGCTFHQSQISENRSTFTSKVSKKGIESMRVKVDCRRRCWKGGVRGDEGSCTPDKLVVPWVPTRCLVGSLLNTIITTRAGWASSP